MMTSRAGLCTRMIAVRAGLKTSYASSPQLHAPRPHARSTGDPGAAGMAMYAPCTCSRWTTARPVVAVSKYTLCARPPSGALRRSSPVPRPRACRRRVAVALKAADEEAPAPPPVPVREPVAWDAPWPVPWGAGTLIGGLGAWAVSFVLIGFYLPAIFDHAGVQVSFLRPPQTSVFLLVMQSVETASGLAILWGVTRRWAPLDPSLFRVDFSRPFDPEDGWIRWGAGGYGVALAVVLVTSSAWELLAAHAFPGGGALLDDSGASTLDGVAPLIGGGSGLAALVLLPVTSVLAPLLEESLFRGFVLPSLAQWVPAPVAIAGSAALFAAAHLAPHDFLQLFALGLVLGGVYSKTRNLAAPMLIHSLWNSGVMLLLVILISAGYDIEHLPF